MRVLLARISVICLLLAVWHFRHAVRLAAELCGPAGLGLAVILAGCGLANMFRRPPAAAVRERPAGKDAPASRLPENDPAGWQPPESGRLSSGQPQRHPLAGDWPPAGLCGSCLSRPAETDRAGWELCGPCAQKIDAVAAHAHEVAGAEIARLAVERARKNAEDAVFAEIARNYDREAGT